MQEQTLEKRESTERPIREDLTSGSERKLPYGKKHKTRRLKKVKRRKKEIA